MALLAAILSSTRTQAVFDASLRRAAHLAFIISDRRFLPAGVSLFRRRRTCALPRLVEVTPRCVFCFFLRSAQRFFII